MRRKEKMFLKINVRKGTRISVISLTIVSKLHQLGIWYRDHCET